MNGKSITSDTLTTPEDISRSVKAFKNAYQELGNVVLFK